MSALVLRADARDLPLPDGCVDLVVTSPPYFGLRSYTDGGAHYDGQIGSEATPAEWLAALLECTREWVRVLKPEGSLFVNLGDKYAGSGGKRWGHQPKSLLGLPWRYALACTDQLGLILRRDIIWYKPNGLPESVTDRCRSSHEYVFHLVRQSRYFSAVDEIREPHQLSTLSRNRYAVNSHTPDAYTDVSRGVLRDMRPAGHEVNPLGKLPGSVWTIPSQPLTVPPNLGVDHFAAFPMELPRRIILGWSPGGVCTGCGHGRRPVSDITRVPHYAGGSKGRAPGVNGGKPGSFDDPRVPRVNPLYTITGYACACTTSPLPPCDDLTACGDPRCGYCHPGGSARGLVLPPTTPAVVLDPFGGTGTTALIAAALGRHGISADLSADYCRLARWRTRDPGERARALEVPKPPPVSDDQMRLFEVTP